MDQVTKNILSLVAYTVVVCIFTILFCVLWILTKRTSPLPPSYSTSTSNGNSSLSSRMNNDSQNVHVLIGPLPVVNIGCNRQMINNNSTTSTTTTAIDGEKYDRSETPPPPYASLFSTD